MVSVPGPTRASCVRIRRCAPGEPGGSSSGLEHLISRRSLPGMSHPWACAGSHRFPGDPSYAFALLQDPGRADKISPWRSCRCCPRATQAEGPNGHIISRLTQGFSIRCLRFTSGVAVAHARLASGWRATPLPGGGRTLWIASKGFRLHPILLSRTSPVARVVYAKRPFAGPAQVLDYVGRYTHRVAISNNRLVSMDDGKVRRRIAFGNRVTAALSLARFGTDRFYPSALGNAAGRPPWISLSPAGRVSRTREPETLRCTTSTSF